MKNLFIFLFISMLLYGCTDNTLEETGNGLTGTTEETTDVTPYPMEVMQQIVDEIAAENGTRSTSIQLQPTHRYIEFIPANSKEFDQLLTNRDFDCTPISIFEEYDIPEGQNYADLVLGGNTPAKLYALVSCDITLPENIVYNVLEEYFTPYSPNSGISDPALAVQIAQRVATKIPIVTPYTPSGRIMIVDELSKKNVPLGGVPVTVIQGGGIGSNGNMLPHKSETVYTDANGYFAALGTFEKKLTSYKITWKTNQWVMKLNNTTILSTIGQADADGKWNPVFSTTTSEEMTRNCAVLSRALYCTEKNGLSLGNHFIYLFPKSSTSYKTEFIENNGTPYIDVPCHYSDCDIMHKTFCELGVAALYFNSTANFFDQSVYLRYSWGAFVANYMLTKEYTRIGALSSLRKYGSDNQELPDAYNKQKWTIYTSEVEINKYFDLHRNPLFIDLYDNYNQSEGLPFLYKPNDYICIPDFDRLKYIAFNSKKISDIKNKMLPRYTEMYGYTTRDITDLFKTYDEFGD